MPTALLGLGGCVTLYGASFGYPDPVPVPHSATVLVSDKGQDDDDPMRARVRVVDIGDRTRGELVAFYRQQFPASEHWTSVHVTGGQTLCLVNLASDAYTELVEVFSFAGSRVRTGPSRYLVVISRFESVDECGAALGWIPSDLV